MAREEHMGNFSQLGSAHPQNPRAWLLSPLGTLPTLGGPCF